MPRTATPAPLDDRRIWRRILARLHPDAGGSEDLFVFGQAVAEAVQEEMVGGGCGECCRLGQSRPGQRSYDSPGPTQPPPPEHSGATDRLDFDPDLDHEGLVERAWAMAASGDVRGPHARLLELLKECASLPEHHHQERRGASFKQLALIAHRAGMSKAQRVGWYEVAQAVPLSQRHAGFLIEQLGERAA